ncbi:peptidase [Paenibacillus sp. BIHB 4019]|uniref:Peptidase n=1 Tax=Paenibacillus sp. BIHB 4019 TaxID=1870819 RepID=A0A1B2DP55_9BACL|nr:S9 family peptidase [Paenibacillus sp. BIHB 4019]ANY69493.1 peptidase [Paenibacillus sp. BIHB 4019]
MPEPKRLIEPEDLYNYSWISDPSLHPVTSSVAYVYKEIDQDKNDYKTHIRVVTIDGQEDASLTDGSKDFAPSWSPDGLKLGFLRVNENGKQLWLADVSAGTAAQLTSAKHGVAAFVWSPDGSAIAFTSRISEEEAQGKLTKEEIVKQESRRGRSYERTIPKAEGSGWWDGRYSQLFRIEVTSGEVTQLTSGKFNVSQPVWTEDGSKLAFLSKKIDDSELDPDLIAYQDLFTVSAVGGELCRITDHSLSISQFSYSPDGSTIALIAEDRKYGSGTQSNIYTVPSSGGAPVAWQETDVQVGNYILNDMRTAAVMPGPLFAKDGTSVFAIGTHHGQAQLYRFREAGAPEPVSSGERDIYQLEESRDSRYFIVLSMDAHGSGELYRLDRLSGEELRLTSWNKAAMDELDISIPETLWFDSTDGDRIQGWMMRPPALPQGEKAPLVLVIHGGPHAMYAPAYSHELQTLASAGYAVLYVNPRGSFGYGQRFAQSCRGDFGGGDYRNLMDAVDVALERFDFIDPERLGVMGGSYGGLMTNWIISQNNRFQAAVSQRCISNWLSFYGTSDIGISYTEGIVGGNPWEQQGLLLEKSPLTYVSQVKAPVLIMHGEQDFRCPVGQSDEWYTALKRLGKQTKLIRYPGSNHAFLKNGKPSYRVEALREVNAWLDKHLAATAQTGGAPDEA